MYRSLAVGGVVVAVLVVGGLVLAQPERAAAPVVGPYSVTTGPDGTILLDTNSGQAWLLFKSQVMHGRTKWLAVGERVGSEKDIVELLLVEKDWLKREAEVRDAEMRAGRVMVSQKEPTQRTALACCAGSAND